ncbi:MAG: PorV/PorQ family protein [Acidobacteriota bacterium]
MKRCIVVLVALLAASTLYAQKEDAGTTGASFLKLGVGARAAGMGFSALTLTQDASALFWNPGALAHIPSTDLTVNYNRLYADMTHSFLGMALPGRDGTFALGLLYYTSGSMTRTEAVSDGTLPFTKTGEFANHDGALMLGYGMSLSDQIHVGLSLKGIFESTGEKSGYGGAIDLGAYAKLEMIDVGISVKNIGPKLKYKNASEPLPLQVLLGTSVYLIPEAFLVTASGGAAGEGKTQFTVGAEYRYDFIAFRAGYRTGLEDVTGSMKGLTGGLGLYYKQIRLDYAYNTYGDLGGVHLISLGFELGDNGSARRSVEAPKYVPSSMPAPAEEVKEEKPLPTKEEVTPVTPDVPKVPTAIVNTANENLRALPSLKGKAVVKVKKNEEVKILDENKLWYLVETAKKKQGWIQKKSLTVAQ